MNNSDLSNKFINKYNSDDYFKNLVINKFGEQFPKPNKFTNFTKLGTKLIKANITSKCSGDAINRRTGWGWTGEHGARDRGVKCCSLFKKGQFGHNIGEHKHIKHKSDHPACGWSGRKKNQDIDEELNVEDWKTWSKILGKKKKVPDWYPERPTKGSRRFIRRTKKLPLPPLRLTKKQQRQQEHNILLKQKQENEHNRKIHEEKWEHVKKNLFNTLTKKQLKKDKNKRKKKNKAKKTQTSSGEGIEEQKNVDEINAILQELENPNTQSRNNGNNNRSMESPKKRKSKKPKKAKKDKKDKKAKKAKKDKKAKKSKKKNITNVSQPNNNNNEEPKTSPITSFINHYE